MAHRLAWFYIHGEWPETIDHKNGITVDNRLENLRAVTKSQNAMNRGVQINNILCVKGVSKSGSKFVARIGVNGVTHYLGTFATVEEASEAYVKAAERHFGSHARKA